MKDLGCPNVFTVSVRCSWGRNTIGQNPLLDGGICHLIILSKLWPEASEQ